MNMKVRKSVIAFLMATTMVGSTAVRHQMMQQKSAPWAMN